METSTQPDTHRSELQDAAGLALTDVRILLDRLARLARNMATPNVDTQIEAFASMQNRGIISASAFSSAASAALLLAASKAGKHGFPAALGALAVRAIDIAADHSQYGERETDREWTASIRRVAHMTRPSLASEWVEAVAQTPLEAYCKTISCPQLFGLDPVLANAAVTLQRATAHYAAAAGKLRAITTQDQPDTMSVGAVFHALISGDRALGRSFSHIATYLRSASWQALAVLPRQETDLPSSSAWLRGAFLTSVSLGLPATIAATIAYRSARHELPLWLNDLTAARRVTVDHTFVEAFIATASNKYLKTVPPKPAGFRAATSVIAAAALETPTNTESAQPMAPSQASKDRPRMKPPVPYPDLPGAGLDTAATMERVARNPFLVKQNVEAH